MPEDPNSLTLALVLTAAGATAAAALITGLVQVLKGVASGVLDGREKLAAFVLSAIIVVVAMAAGVQDGTMTLSIATLFGAFLAWYGIARLSMAVYDDASGTATPSSLRSD